MKEYSKNKKVILAAVLCVVVTFVAVVFIMAKISNTGTNRYFVWDRRVVDEEKTTAALVQHSPVKQDKVFTTDKPWEGDISDSFNIVDTGDLYIMYYSTYDTKDDVKICVAQSEDGIIWEKPCLNIVGFNGDKNNNILFDSSSGIISFFAFEDVNPKAANSKRYKAVALMEDNSIMTYTSADGISWKENKAVENISISSESKDVTLASAFWNKHSKKYFCYFSVYNNGKYEIMQSTSNNFKKWTESEKISFTSELDFSLRTANVIPYMRSDEMLIGFPMRITEIDKHDTDVNFDKDSAEDNRLTDALLISSVDGINFDVSGDAWIVPGPQHDSNWSYGDCFVANGIISTPSLHSDKGQDDELSVYVAENMFSDRGTSLARYTLRTDGFASYNAGFNTEKLVTKPLKITGSRMTVNFRTSTDGYVYVRVVDENGQLYKDIEYTLEGGTVYTVPEYTSYKMIGDRVDREVVFNGDFSKLKGKTAVIEFYMSDADVYSFSFDNEDYATENRWQPEEIEIREYGDFSYDVPENPVDIGTERQLFVDDYIIDKAKTDASLLLNSPVKKEELFKTDKPWEGNNCDFYVIVDDVDDEGIKYHRMYYLAWNSSDTSHDIRVCYAYSYDGVEWIKPELDILTYTDKNTGEVYTKTNILLCKEDVFDNFFVIKDTRPGVPASQRYKAIRQNEYDQLGYPSYGLWSWVSSDGLHWKKIHRLLPYIPGSWGTFDSLNTLVWDANTQQFFTYVRVKNQEIINGVDIPDFRKIYGKNLQIL